MRERAFGGLFCLAGGMKPGRPDQGWEIVLAGCFWAGRKKPCLAVAGGLRAWTGWLAAAYTRVCLAAGLVRWDTRAKADAYQAGKLKDASAEPEVQAAN